MRRLVLIVLIGMVFALFASPLLVQGKDVHTSVRASLIALELEGQNDLGQSVRSYGTGFLTHSGGYLLTSAHLFDDLTQKGANPATFVTKAYVSDFSSSPVTAKLVDKNKHDVALLKLEHRTSGYKSLRRLCSNNFPLAEAQLYTSGFFYHCSLYEPSAKTCLKGELKYHAMSVELGSTDGDIKASTYQLNSAVSYGNSGSPVYLQNGVVVGVVKGNVASADSKSVFVPISWAEQLLSQVPGDSACVDMKSCINAAVADLSTEKFNVSGEARSARNGAQIVPVTDTQSVCYVAPDGYEIDGQVSIRDDGNNEGRGSIGLPEYMKDKDGRLIRACVKVMAWSDSKLFGAEGWQYVTISGLIRKRDVDKVTQSRAGQVCSRYSD